MKIKLEKEYNMPNGFYCDKCSQIELDAKGRKYCRLYNLYLTMRKGRFVKIRSCVEDTLDALWRNS